jgi:hypothetical protein
MAEIYYLAIIIAIFSVIQSIFGVGILLFGTPTLLLLEYSYSETLWILVPCSVVISLIQVVNDYKLIEAKKRAVYLVIPSLIFSLTIVVIYATGLNITKLVGVLLLFIGVIRFSSRLQDFLGVMVKKKTQFYYIVIGLVHGVTNMGGGPLTILMSSIYSKKEIIRANVAFIYLILAMFQLAVLSIISFTSIRSEFMWLIPITLMAYFFTKKFISSKVNDKKYAFILNVMVLVYGAMAIIK